MGNHNSVLFVMSKTIKTLKLSGILPRAGKYMPMFGYR
jgi:hypothetical protein